MTITTLTFVKRVCKYRQCEVVYIIHKLDTRTLYKH